MPFVIRKVEPRFLCRGHVPSGTAAQDLPVGAELEAVANGALTGSLKQLASLLTTAEDIFAELTRELTVVVERSAQVRRRLDKVEQRLTTVDPKKVPVPESDICTFAARTEHFHVTNKPSTALFTSNTRPKALKELYEAAGVVAVRSLDSLRRDGSSMDMFLCTPVLGKRRRDQSLDIESRVPAAIEDLRRWTSAEALGDVTVPPDCMSRILGDTADDDAVDHKLPSPEEQVQAVALKFPAEIVAVDVSGRGFERMSMRRRSLLSGPEMQQETNVKRRSRPRRPRGKRRNTIAGTDQKEIRQAIGGETTTGDEPEEAMPSTTPRAHRSASTDILGCSSKKDTSTEKKSHFNTLKAWGMSRLKSIGGGQTKSGSQQQLQDASESNANRSEQGQSQSKSSTDDANIYETVNSRRKKDKSHQRKPSSSSSSGKSTSSIPVSIPVTSMTVSRPSSTERAQGNVKLRESAAQRRERRKGSSRDDAPHSSSGNWSASSESGRASIGSETTTTTHQPRSTTTASIGTSSTSLSHARRLKGRDTSASSSVTSEGTLTPDIIQDIAVVPFSDDGETSSVYSCDTEGYYTSFHVDSGLKTLREEEPLPQSPLTKTNGIGSDPTSPIIENEYELFGRGSTSTTTSSAGTVCTALLAPPPPERKSSLTVVAMVHGENQNGGESPDSGHNTSSSPVESASSPACTGRSCSEFEYSESSDLEGCERIERIRSKTAINSSRIPSMCVITPPCSDDEHVKDVDLSDKQNQIRNKNDVQATGSVLMSATVGTSKMEVINGQDKNLYATVQHVIPSSTNNNGQDSNGNNNDRPITNNHQSTQMKISPLSGVLGKLRGVLPGRKHVTKNAVVHGMTNSDSGDYVTIADVRNNNDKRPESSSLARSAPVTYANSDLFKRDAEYVCLSELPKKPDSSLERKRQGARVTLDSEGKVVYSSDSLKRRKGAHTTFNPGPFVREGISPNPSPLLRRAMPNVRAVIKSHDTVDSSQQKTPSPIPPSPSPLPTSSTSPPTSPPTSPQLGKLIIRAAKSPDRAQSPDYVRTPATVVGPKSPTSPHKQVRGAYVNVQAGDEDNGIYLVVPSESLVMQQSATYIGPQPVPGDKEKSHKYKEIITKDTNQVNHRQRMYQEEIRNQGNNDEKRVYHEKNNTCTGNNSSKDDHYRCYNDEEKFIEQNRIGRNYCDHQLHNCERQSVQIQNTKNEGFNMAGRAHCDQQRFYTLPTRRAQREIEPPRSVTPDITRGLGYGSLSAMHMLIRQGRRSVAEQVTKQVPKQVPEQVTTGQVRLAIGNRKLEEFEKRKRLMQQQQTTPNVDVRNRFATPLSQSALGYRFLAFSPINEPIAMPPASTNLLNHDSISPIGVGYGNGFESSTPIARSSRTVAERLALTTANSPSPVPSSSGRSTPVLGSSSSGRNTPTNLILSPSKSTMSNEELFTAIHKSKKRLNIKDDSENMSPYGSMNSLIKTPPGNRHSWSPESQKQTEIPTSQAIHSPSSTSRLDFKRLLLQQSVKVGPTRLSAAEQLKLSRQQCQQQQQQQQQQHHQQLLQSPGIVNFSQTPLTKVMSPRSVWRFQTPRTDVLSSTIIEDTAAEEKAMKPSPENTSPISRLNSKRQLDLGNDPPQSNNLRNTMKEDNTFESCDGRLSSVISNSYFDKKKDNCTPKRTVAQTEPKVLSSFTVVENSAANTTTTTTTTTTTNNNNNNTDMSQQYSQNSAQITSKGLNAVNAIESRRLSNQLARAQFLASTPNSNNRQGQSAYFGKRFRARSESPKHVNSQNVTTVRSPSAPTLETAL